MALFQSDENEVMFLVQNLIKPGCKIRFTMSNGNWVSIRTIEAKEQLLFPIYAGDVVPISVSQAPLQNAAGTQAIVGQAELFRRLQNLIREEAGITWSVCLRSRQVLRQWQSLVAEKFSPFDANVC